MTRAERSRRWARRVEGGRLEEVESGGESWCIHRVVVAPREDLWKIPSGQHVCRASLNLYYLPSELRTSGISWAAQRDWRRSKRTGLSRPMENKEDDNDETDWYGQTEERFFRIGFDLGKEKEGAFGSAQDSQRWPMGNRLVPYPSLIVQRTRLAYVQSYTNYTNTYVRYVAPL